MIHHKCDDLESRSRHNIIRIIGIPEDNHALTSTDNVLKLLREAFALDREPLVDRAHRTLTPKPKAAEWPWAVVARLHY